MIGHRKPARLRVAQNAVTISCCQSASGAWESQLFELGLTRGGTIMEAVENLGFAGRRALPCRDPKALGPR